MAERSLRLQDEVDLELGPFVPGGLCLARLDGRVVLVRHGLPGERVRARVTSISAKVVFAEVVAVASPSPDRVEPPCALVPRCGGCDLQHASRPAQLALKAQIIRDALRRQGGLDPGAIDDLGITVRPLDADGTGWRTTVRWHRDAEGRPGFRGWREHEVVPVEACAMLAPGLAAAMGEPDATRARLGTDGGVGLDDDVTVQEVAGRRWEVSGATFWQGHRQAASALVASVLDHGAPQPGETWVDLYAGAGLFSAFLADAVGPRGSVTAVEQAGSSVVDGRRALADLPQVRFVEADAASWTASGPVDGVVLDPPRTGAAPGLVASLIAAHPARIVYVACDPVTFARDVRALSPAYRLVRLEALDAFPMTHHVETIATLLPDSASDEVS